MKAGMLRDDESLVTTDNCGASRRESREDYRQFASLAETFDECRYPKNERVRRHWHPQINQVTAH